LVGQTGDAPRVRLFGAGPITDNLGTIILPSAATWDFEDAQLINCTRALSWDATGTYSLNGITLSGNLVGGHNDSGGLVTGNINNGSTPPNTELLGASTFTFNNTVTLTVTIVDAANSPVQNVQVSIHTDDTAETQLMNELTNASGIATESFAFVSDQAIFVRARGATLSPPIQDEERPGTITSSGFTSTIAVSEDTVIT
jgi:hypothetical protein